MPHQKNMSTPPSLATRWVLVNLLPFLGTGNLQKSHWQASGRDLFTCITAKLRMRHVFIIMHFPKPSIAYSSTNFKYRSIE